MMCGLEIVQRKTARKCEIRDVKNTDSDESRYFGAFLDIYMWAL